MKLAEVLKDVIPTGTFCECGCGQLAPVAKITSMARGCVKGRPLRFVYGHRTLLKPHERIHYTIDAECGCWLWSRAINNKGYGRLSINKKQVLAHRYVYETVRGPIPGGLSLDHKCSNRRCVNPDHLEPVTHKENCRRGRKTRMTPGVRQRIRELYSSGVGVRAIGREVGFYHATVSSVIRDGGAP